MEYSIYKSVSGNSLYCIFTDSQETELKKQVFMLIINAHIWLCLSVLYKYEFTWYSSNTVLQTFFSVLLLYVLISSPNYFPGFLKFYSFHIPTTVSPPFPLPTSPSSLPLFTVFNQSLPCQYNCCQTCLLPFNQEESIHSGILFSKYPIYIRLHGNELFSKVWIYSRNFVGTLVYWFTQIVWCSSFKVGHLTCKP